MFKYGIDYLTVGKVLDILHGRLKAGFAPEAIEKIEKSHNDVLAIASRERTVYGINTGFGPLCDTIIAKDKTSDLQKRLLLSHSVGVGEPVSKEISKLMMILKLHALAQGYSGISMEVMNRILWHIENDVVPVVPEQGSVGASGDLAPLAHLFLPLIGEGKVIYKDEIVDTARVLEKFNMKPLELHPKAGLALINGTQFIAAHAVMVVDTLYNCLSHADIIAALMIEGLLGSKMPFHENLHKTRPFKGNIHVAKRIDSFLSGSEIVESHKNCTKVQDPYSLRCVPQVHGSSRNAWLHLKEAVETELNAVTDNPVVFSDEFTISGGNFHGQPLALPLDYACLAAAELGNISDRRSYLALEGKTEGTPKLLMEEIGLSSGFMIVQYTSAALASENKSLCFPASADSIPTSLGQEDHVSMGSIGGRKALRVCENVIKILGVELLCAAQAFDFRTPLKSGETLNAVHKHVREHITHAKEDRIFSDDIEKAIAIIKSKALLEISEKQSDLTNNEYHKLFEVY
ncbi:histidine ammonia-lyase [Flavobacteriaceae bacterium R38]|nr:histidine ammonia-lyase [Flavobacteriaceae bacterium R38]